MRYGVCVGFGVVLCWWCSDVSSCGLLLVLLLVVAGAGLIATIVVCFQQVFTDSISCLVTATSIFVRDGTLASLHRLAVRFMGLLAGLQVHFPFCFFSQGLCSS